MQFTTGTGSWSLQSGSFYGVFSQTVTLEIWTVVDPAPSPFRPTTGTLVGSAQTSLNSFTAGTHEMTFAGSGLTLAGGTSYWAIFTSDFFQAPLGGIPSAQNSSGWIGSSTAYSKTGFNTFDWASSSNIFYELNATSASAVPGAGLAGLATVGLAGVSRRRRR